VPLASSIIPEQKRMSIGLLAALNTFVMGFPTYDF
jgi:hypothetical protein